MSPDAFQIILPVADLIGGPLYPQTTHVHQKDAGFDPLAGLLEPGNDDPADALFKKILWPKCFVRFHWGTLRSPMDDGLNFLQDPGPAVRQNNFDKTRDPAKATGPHFLGRDRQ